MSNSASLMINTEGQVLHLPQTRSSTPQPQVPIWEKYTLTIEEAAAYFRIGENKLRQIVTEHPDETFILWNGNRAQIKRKLFEKYIDACQVI